jgi:hypothetical protein
MWEGKTHVEKSLMELASLQLETLSTKVWHITLMPNGSWQAKENQPHQLNQVTGTKKDNFLNSKLAYLIKACGI